MDVVAPMETSLTLDATTLSTQPIAIGTSGFGIARVPIPKGGTGAHIITGSNPFGIQVVGYGLYTSYQFPGGLNLDAIAPVPVL